MGRALPLGSEVTVSLLSQIADAYGPAYDLGFVSGGNRGWLGSSVTPQVVRDLWTRCLTAEAQATGPRPNLHFYVHIPFCTRVCRYCCYYTLPLRGDASVDGYLDWLEGALDYFAPAFSNRPFDTLYFGGGTPSSLSVEQIDRVLRAVSSRYEFAPRGERSFECNPDSVTPEKLDALARHGINRISMGVQTYDARSLERENRGYQTPEMVRDAVLHIQRHGSFVLNVDLIMGLEGTSSHSFVEAFRRVVDLHPDHITAYSLAPAHAIIGVRPSADRPVFDPRSGGYDRIIETVVDVARKHGYQPNERVGIGGHAWGFVSRPSTASADYDDAWPNVRALFGLGPTARSTIPGAGFCRQDEGVERTFDPTRESGRLRLIDAHDEVRDFVVTHCRSGEPIVMEEARERFGQHELTLLDEMLRELEGKESVRREDGVVVLPKSPRDRFAAALQLMPAAEVEKLFAIDVVVSGARPTAFRLSRRRPDEQYMAIFHDVGLIFHSRNEPNESQRKVIDLAVRVANSMSGEPMSEAVTEVADLFARRLQDALAQHGIEGLAARPSVETRVTKG